MSSDQNLSSFANLTQDPHNITTRISWNVSQGDFEAVIYPIVFQSYLLGFGGLDGLFLGSKYRTSRSAKGSLGLFTLQKFFVVRIYYGSARSAHVLLAPHNSLGTPKILEEKTRSFSLERFLNGWKMFIQKWIITVRPSKNSGNEAIRGYDGDAGTLIPYFSGQPENGRRDVVEGPISVTFSGLKTSL